MQVSFRNNKTGKSYCCNAQTASDIIGVEISWLYRLSYRGITEYRHFTILWNVEVVKSKPRGRAYVKGQNGYIKAILSKAKPN